MTIDKLLQQRQLGLKSVSAKLNLIADPSLTEDNWIITGYELSSSAKTDILSLYFTTVLGMNEIEVNNFMLAQDTGFAAFIDKKKNVVPSTAHYMLFWNIIAQIYPALVPMEDVTRLSAKRNTAVYQLLDALLKTGTIPPLESLAYITHLIR